MALKLKNGIYALRPGRIPLEATPLEETLQNALLRLSMPLGGFPYGRELGSRLSGLDRTGEHAAEQAVALANEALLDMAGVRAKTATFLSNNRIRFALSTPWGEGTVLYGAI